MLKGLIGFPTFLKKFNFKRLKLLNQEITTLYQDGSLYFILWTKYKLKKNQNNCVLYSYYI